MISLDNAVLARLESRGLKFEVWVDPEKARGLAEGKNIPLDEVIAAREIFSDAKKGKRAAESDLNLVFGTSDFEKVVLQIIKRGQIQLTTEQKRKLQEKRIKEIVALIAQKAVDPRTHAPYPPERISSAMNEVKVHIDPFKTAEEQVKKVLDSIKAIIPISMETDKILVRIPAQHAMKLYGYLKSHKLLKEEWKSDGSLEAVVLIAAGMQSEFYDKLNKVTSGQVEAKVIEKK